MSTSVDRIKGLSSGLAIKAPVLAATTAAIALSGLQTVDGVVVPSGGRVLVKDQADAITNGVYDASTSAWQRSADADGANDFTDGTLVSVAGGTQGSKLWRLSSSTPVTVGVTALTFLPSLDFADLPAISPFIETLLDDADAIAARTTLGVDTHTAAVKATIVDADELGFLDSAASWVLKKCTFANLKATLKTYFDTLYATVGSVGSRGHLGGCTLSTAGASTTMGVSAGQATDSTHTTSMTLSALAKTTGAWAVGTAAGGLDTGAIANNTWYHFFVIRRPDTGIVDVLFSLSPTAPTLPANYTHFRRIGAWKTNGSAQWASIIQDGDLFQWATPALDIDVVNPGTAAVSRTLNVPTGVNVVATFNFASFDGSGATVLYANFSDLATADNAPSNAAAPLSPIAGGASTTVGGFGQTSVRTNTSAQIRTRINATSATQVLRISTLSWIDSRGRNA